MSPRLTVPIFFLHVIFIALSRSFSNAAGPKTLAARVTRDSATGFYAIQMHQKTPLEAERLVLDIQGDSVWVHCQGGAYTSSTYRRVACGTAICSASSEGRCGNLCYGPGICHNNTCIAEVYNAYLDLDSSGDLSQDVVALFTIHGAKVTIPRFAFSCAPSISVNEMGKGIAGLAGLNKAVMALPTQLSATLGFNNKFAICLPGGRGNVQGVVFFGNEPYVFSPGIDVSKHLTYTPLVQYGQHKNQHYISVNTIQIDTKKIAVPTGTVARLDSIYRPYSFFATPIYTAFLAAFLKAAEARNITRVSAVKPFEACFDAKSIPWTRVGPRVPTINFVLHNNSQTVWKILGANSMVPVKRHKVLCLAFFDAGPNGGTEGGYDVGPIVISTHQMRDNLLEFDIANNRFGFSSTLLGLNTTCSNFKFSSF